MSESTQAFETPPYVDYTAKVSSGSFRPDRRVSPAVRLTRVEWGLVCAFAHCDTVLALRGVSRRLYAAASDPRIWAQLIDRDMPRHTHGDPAELFRSQLQDALQRDSDEEEDSWRALTSPSGQKTGRDKCLREEYGALRFALWCQFLTRGDGPHPLNHYAMLLRMLYQRRCSQWGLHAVTPTDHRDATALHAFCFDSAAGTVLKGAAARAAKFPEVNVFTVIAFVIVCDRRETPVLGAFLAYLADKATVFSPVPFNPIRLSIVPAFDTETGTVLQSMTPPPAFFAVAAGLVLLSVVRAVRTKAGADRAAIRLTSTVQPRVVARACRFVPTICNEALMCIIGGVCLAIPSVVVVGMVHTMWKSCSSAIAAARYAADGERQSIKTSRAVSLRDAAEARGETGCHVEARDLSLTDQASTVSRKEKLAIARTTVVHALGAAAIAAAAWKAKDAAALFHSGVIALPLPVAVSAAIDTMPSGNVVWSVAWTLMVSAHRCTSAEAKDQPSLSLHAAGLPTPFVPEDFPETADAFQARLDADKEVAVADGKERTTFMYFDELLLTVAQLSLRAAGYPFWMEAAFRTTVSVLQSLAETCVLRVL